MSGWDTPNAEGELGDGHRADLREEADDAQPGLVAEGPVEDAQAPQVCVAASFVRSHSGVHLYQMGVYM